MKQMLAVPVVVVFLLGLAQGASAVQRGSTGDRKLDSTLRMINIEADSDLNGFLAQLSSRHKIMEEDIRQAKEMYGLGAADIFMATALAQPTHRTVLAVAENYRNNSGRGWGDMAKDMGIKPGSRAFHELKTDARVSLAHIRSAAKSKQKHEQAMQKEHDQRMKREPKGKGNGNSR